MELIQGSDGKVDLSKFSRLAQALIQNRQFIFERWEKALRQEVSPAKSLATPVLIDTLPLLIVNIAESLSPDYPRDYPADHTNIPTQHGAERGKFTLYQAENLVQEYRILERVIFSVLDEQKVEYGVEDLKKIHHFIQDAIHDSVVSLNLIHQGIRERFVATLSHDLRNPLGAAQVTAQLIKRLSKDKEIHALAQRILENHSRIDRMVQDLLDVTAVKSGDKMNLTDIAEWDMLSLLQQMADQFNQTHGNRFELYGNSCKGFWSASAIKRALENLLTNAVKYGAADKVVQIGLTCEKGKVFISVKNHGKPIPEEEQELIFQAFRRSNSATHQNCSGWGLGLALVKAVAEAHGGVVILDSSLERGTTFTMAIPDDARDIVA